MPLTLTQSRPSSAGPSGVYTIALRLPRAIVDPIPGAPHGLPAGWYVYVGSARNGIIGRLARHLRPHRRVHWHIDRLLAAAKVVDVQLRFSQDPAAECGLAAEVRTWPGATPVHGFGASDCRCGSHLTRFHDRPGASLGAPAVRPHLAEMYDAMRSRYADYTAEDNDPFETLVACILSLRTQDPVTDAAAARLFAVIHTPPEFCRADPETIARIIYPVGMYRQKARTLIAIARRLCERFSGRTPCEIDDLLSLPGVGRKTANLVRSFAFRLPAICVDTHVHRITNRWGLVRTATPDHTECELRNVLPPALWLPTNPFLVQHGQQICRPTAPRCARCFLAPWCGYPALVGERRVLAAIAAAPPHPSLRLPFDGPSAAPAR
jgi:endonuclease-3